MNSNAIKKWLLAIDTPIDIEAPLYNINIKMSSHKNWTKACMFSCISSDGGHPVIIDVRYAFSKNVFNHNLIDFFYDDISKLENNLEAMPYSKIVIYIFANKDDISPISAPLFFEDKEFLSKQVLWSETNNKYLLSKKIINEWIGYISINGELKPEENKTSFNTKNNQLHARKSLVENGKEPYFLHANSRYKPYQELSEKKSSKRTVSPCVSVITVVYNNESLVEQSIQSVINQNSDNFEYIIIDGNSTDGTLNIIEKYDSLIDCWLSESDSGIYDAMNKGIALSKGEWLIFLNSDDLFFSCESLNFNFKYENHDAIAGRCLTVGKYYNWIRPFSRKDSLYRYSHQAIFTKKKSFYNLNYKIAADSEYLSEYNSRFKHSDKIISIFRMGGYSTNEVSWEHVKERYKMLGVVSTYLLIARFFIQNIMGDKALELLRINKNRFF